LRVDIFNVFEDTYPTFSSGNVGYFRYIYYIVDIMCLLLKHEGCDTDRLDGWRYLLRALR